MKLRRYVVGLIYDELKEHLLLIRKVKPEWQCGLLNGVGGLIEDFDQSPLDAMVRECKEETNLSIPKEDWVEFLRLYGDTWEVYYFWVIADIEEAEAMTVEPLKIIQTCNYSKVKCVPNLKWAIPLSLVQNINFPVSVSDNSVGQ
jgi:8-oxo-dGTP diphosphatase